MNILVAEHCGLCEGAARALRITQEQLETAGKPIVLYNDLLHNATVMNRLRAHGVQTVHDIADVPESALAIVSAHGMAEDNFISLLMRSIPCVDATCPKVISIHNLVRQASDAGKAVVIVGKKNHPEVLGTAGWCQNACIVQDESDLAALAEIPQNEVLVVCQSTFNEARAEALVEKIRAVLPDKTVTVKNTICPAQRKIQHSSVEMAKECDRVFVLGGLNSSNTVELYNLCAETGTPCHHVDSLAGFYRCVQELALPQDGTYGITAGASTTKEEIESCRTLLAWHLFQARHSEGLAEALAAFNQSLAHGTPLVQQFIDAFTSVNRGGKNIRGTLVALGYQLAGGQNPEESRPLGLAAEIFQTAILIHDDIIDHAPFRRGLRTVPYQYRDSYAAIEDESAGETADVADSVGICAGDVGFYYANRLLAQRYGGHPQLGAVLAYFSNMAIHTMYGEVLDVLLPFEERHDIAPGNREDGVLEIYHLKTAWYSVAGPLGLGMLLAGAPEEQVRAVEALADHLGLAFQIKDDLMGIFAEEADLGKPMSDIAEYKQTLLYAFVHDQRPELMPQLKAHYGHSPLAPEDVAAVRALFTESGARAYAEERMESLFALAREQLNGIDFINQADKTLLQGFMGYLQLRAK